MALRYGGRDRVRVGCVQENVKTVVFLLTEDPGTGEIYNFPTIPVRGFFQANVALFPVRKPKPTPRRAADFFAYLGWVLYVGRPRRQFTLPLALFGPF